MKTILSLLLLTLTLSASAQTTSELRQKYVEKNLGLPKPTLDKLAPVLKAYIKEMKQAGDIYDDAKDLYKTSIKNDNLSDKQAAALNKARFESEAKELEVKRAYYPKLKAIVSEKYVWKIYKLASDKKSKFMPTKNGKSDDE